MKINVCAFIAWIHWDLERKKPSLGFISNVNYKMLLLFKYRYTRVHYEIISCMPSESISPWHFPIKCCALKCKLTVPMWLVVNVCHTQTAWVMKLLKPTGSWPPCPSFEERHFYETVLFKAPLTTFDLQHTPRPSTLTFCRDKTRFLQRSMAGIQPPIRAVHYWSAKFMGATMWCWIFWRFKHDWKDVLVCIATWLLWCPC